MSAELFSDCVDRDVTELFTTTRALETALMCSDTSFGGGGRTQLYKHLLLFLSYPPPPPSEVLSPSSGALAAPDLTLPAGPPRTEPC